MYQPKIQAFGILSIVKINNTMTRKKKVKEQQPATAEVVEAKKQSSKKAPKTKMSAQKESVQETGVQEPTVKEENTKDSFKDKDDTSSQEQEYTIEDMLSALDESIDNDDEECVSDEILDKFDKTLEEKGLGDDYFQKKEERLKEMELKHELHEFDIDEMPNE